MKNLLLIFVFALCSIVSSTAQEAWKGPYATRGDQEMKLEEAEYNKVDDLFYFKTDSLHFFLSQGRLRIYQSVYDSIPAYNTIYSKLEKTEGFLLHALSEEEEILTFWFPTPAWRVKVGDVYDSSHYTLIEYTPVDVNWQEKAAWNTNLTTHDVETQLYHTCSFIWENYKNMWVRLFDGMVDYKTLFYPHQAPGESYTNEATFMPPITLFRK